MRPDEKLDLLRQIAEFIPVNRVIGIELVSVAADGASMVVDDRPELANNPRSAVLNGGVISSLLDTVGGFSALSALVFEKSSTRSKASSGCSSSSAPSTSASTISGQDSETVLSAAGR